ncbi:hypothetical protein V6Z11_A07G032400 [Gossypium hirsutum]
MVLSLKEDEAASLKFAVVLHSTLLGNERQRTLSVLPELITQV